MTDQPTNREQETSITILAGPQLPPGVEEQTKAVREMLKAFVEYYGYNPEFELRPIERENGSRLTLFYAKVFDAEWKPITAARFALEHRLWIALNEPPEDGDDSADAPRVMANRSYSATAIVDDPNQIIGTPEPGVPPTPPGSGGPTDWEPRPVTPDNITGQLPPLYFDFQNGFDPNSLGLSINSKIDGVDSQDVNIFVVDNRAFDKDTLLEMLDKFQANNPLAVEMSKAMSNSQPTPQRLFVMEPVGDPVSSPPESLVKGINWHGVFIVGILLSLTKRAKIYLVPNMNSYGYTSLRHVVDALYNITSGRNDVALINLSMTFRDRAINRTELAGLLKVILSSPTANYWQQYILDTTNPLNYSAEVQSAFDDAYATFLVGEPSIKASLVDPYTSTGSVNQPPMQIIAAAGNMQGLSGDDLPYREVWPGYPARINKVLPVGALNRDFNQADYSQYCEIPTIPIDVKSIYSTLFGNTATGIYTFGGDRLGWSTPQTGKGIIGLFLNDYPRFLDAQAPFPNLSGLAEWSGTSFATAVITGLLARMIETGQTLEGAKNTLLTAKNIPLLQTAVTRPDWLKN